MEGEPPRCDRRCLGAATAAEAALWGLGQCGGLTRRREMKCFFKKYNTNVIPIIIQPKEYIYIYPTIYTYMKDGADFDIEIHEVGY
jgi:hypothetical protein